MTSIHRVISALMSYPEPELIEALPEIDAALEAHPLFRHQLQPLLKHLRTESLVALQEDYVATFDRSRHHSLHLFEHIHGENRERGDALLDLLNEYRRNGFVPSEDDGLKEMPDYLPLFLEYLSQQPEAEAARLLGDAVHVIALIGKRLAGRQHPYTVLFSILVDLSPVPAREIEDAPARDMETLLEIEGPSPDGSEPLLKPDNGMIKTIRFYR